MMTARRTCALALLALLCVGVAGDAGAQRRPRPAPATRADVERLEQKLAEQERVIAQLVAAHREYLRTLSAILDGKAPAPAPDRPPTPAAATASAPTTPPPAAPAPTAGPAAAPVVAAAPPARAAAPRAAAPRKPQGTGTLVGKVTGAPGAVIYVEDLSSTGRGTAEMRQEGKQFHPSVLVVQKGTKVSFPNRDAIFHNVFSMSPDHTFDLGSYPQGETRLVTMVRPGVVTVYCNMHPQMIGHILVVPGGHWVRAGADGFFRLPNVPAGSRRVVAWAPNAKPATVNVAVGTDEVVTIDVALARSKSTMHTRSDGRPYGSYDR